MSRLFFRSPAVRWQQALPIGNGKTAVMVYGGRKKERLCFNDAEFWSGAPSVHDRAVRSSPRASTVPRTISSATICTATIPRRICLSPN